ncbi:hypothetical protein ACFL0M_00305 [Thermodesulfobacteriota bacterium]
METSPRREPAAVPESCKISGYQFKEPSEVPVPKFKKAALPKQLSLDFKAAGVPVPETVSPAQRSRMATAGNIAASNGNLVWNVYATGALLAHSRSA